MNQNSRQRGIPQRFRAVENRSNRLPPTSPHNRGGIKPSAELILRRANAQPGCRLRTLQALSALRDYTQTLCSANSRYRPSTFTDFHPPARIIAAVSNPAQRRSCAAPTRSE